MVVTGFASTASPVLDDKPVVGDHTYVSAPKAVNVVVSPSQMVSLLTVIVGNELTITVVVITESQPVTTEVSVVV